MTAAHVLVELFCAMVLLTVGYVAVVEGRVAHQRGMARVHRAGRSWQRRPLPASGSRSVSPDEPVRKHDGSLLVPTPDWRVGA